MIDKEAVIGVCLIILVIYKFIEFIRTEAWKK